MSLLFAGRKAASDVLGTISSGAELVSTAVQAAADITAAGALHAAHYRKVTEATLAIDLGEMAAIAENNADLRVARRNVELATELDANSALKAEFARVKALRLTKAKGLSIAAE